MNQRTVVTLSFSLFVAAVLWGGYTLIMYLGMPIHELVYSTQEDIRSLDLTCGSDGSVGSLFCRGSTVIVPFVLALFQMGSPFMAYVILSLLAYAAALLWNGYRTGYFQIRTRLRPAYLIGAFALSIWLIATTLSLGTLYNANTPQNQMIADTGGNRILPPFNRFYEPLPQVYSGVGEQGLEELQANYQSLLARGCLTEVGTTQNGARIYDMHFFCMQQSFFARAGLQFLLISVFLLNLLALGRFLLRRALRITQVHPLLTMCFSLGLGALGWVVILWSLGIAGQLNTPLIRVLFLGMPILLFQESWWWLKSAWNDTFECEVPWNSILPILAWLLITYLALNFLNVVRPFPIGWDDLGSYLNRPRLLSSYGTFIASMSQFQWEYLTSIGFLFFGYDSWHGSTFAMEINWTAGLLATLVVYTFGRLYFGRGRGLISAICFYFLPMVGHFSFADMKIDNAVFFASTLGLLAACVTLMPSPSEDEGHRAPRQTLIIAGLMAAFAFAIKPTAMLSILMIASVIGGSFLGALGFTGMTILGFAALQRYGPLDLNTISERALLGVHISTPTLVFGILVVIGLGILGYAISRNRTLLRPLLHALGFFIAGMVISMLPWMLHNAWIGQNFQTGTLLAAPDLTTPQVFYQQKEEVDTWKMPSTIPVHTLSPDLKLDTNHAACKTSARTEELDRYWGFDKGIAHYLGLPWRQVMNIDGFGYYVTLMPALLLFPLLLLLPFFWSKERKWLRLIFAGTFVFFIQWALVANGIAWYGIGMFLGFALAMEAFIAFAPDMPNRSIFSFLITMSIIVCLLNRLWQFDTQKNIFEYPLGKVTAEALREITIPDYDDIRESVVTRHETLPDTPYTYRIGTFISYFIPRNREILPVADHQLNFFNCLNQERNHSLTLQRLKALGFNSIIFDTNTQTIEKDPNGSLHQKVNAFLAFANDLTLNLSIPVNDPGNGIAYILLPTGTGGTVQ